MKIELLGINIDTFDKEDIVKKISSFMDDNLKSHYIVTPNPEMVMRAYHDYHFQFILRDADLAIPDGIGLLWAAKFLSLKSGRSILRSLRIVWQMIYSELSLIFYPSFCRKILPDRITGTDLIDDIARLSEKKNQSIYFLGAASGIAEKASAELKKKFIDLKIAGCLSVSATKKNESYIINQINKSGAEIVLVAFGAPKQEKWIASNINKCSSVKLMIGVGGAFDFISGAIKRSPALMRKLGLEWLFRLIKEPRRGKRIYTAVVRFPLMTLSYKLRVRQAFRKNVIGIIFKREDGIKALVFNRAGSMNHWQFIQGGVENNEKEEAAALREIKEEINLQESKLSFYNKSDKINKYIWPLGEQFRYNKIGQAQAILLFEFRGKDSDITLNKDVFSDFKWINPEELIRVLHPVRRRTGNIVRDELNNAK